MSDQDSTKWEGRADEAGGKAKEMAGKMTGNEDTEAEGKAQQGKGKVKEEVGKAKEKVKDIFKK